MTGTNKNQGEGNREAARNYNRDATEHAKNADVDAEAKRAREALEGAEGEDLKRAEAEGKAQAKGTDKSTG